MGLYSPIVIHTTIILTTRYPGVVLSEKDEITKYKNGESIYITNQCNQMKIYIIVGHHWNSSFSPDYFYSSIYVVPALEFYSINSSKNYIGYYFQGNWDRVEQRVVNKKKIIVQKTEDNADDKQIKYLLQQEGRTLL